TQRALAPAAHDFGPTGVLPRLEAARSRVEDRFLNAGSALAETLEIVGGLIEALAELGGALDGEAVDGTTRDLLAAAGRLSALPALQAARRESLEKVQGGGARLRAHVEDMRQTLKYLRVFALNIKITSAGAGEFKGFAEEMLARLEFGI